MEAFVQIIRKYKSNQSFMPVFWRFVGFFVLFWVNNPEEVRGNRLMRQCPEIDQVAYEIFAGPALEWCIAQYQPSTMPTEVMEYQFCPQVFTFYAVIFVPRRNEVAEGGYWITLRPFVCPSVRQSIRSPWMTLRLLVVTFGFLALGLFHLKSWLGDVWRQLFRPLRSDFFLFIS